MSELTPPTICPHCGYSLQPDISVARAGWVISQQYVFYNGAFIELSPTHRAILHTLVRAYPHGLHIDALQSRVSYGDSNVITTQVCHLRKKLRDLGLPVPISTTQEGYLWSDAPVPHRAYSHQWRKSA